jgi:GTP-binding protein Era
VSYRCGHAAIAGRPNVGKSTLLNRLVGQKLSITSRKPQTTRWNLLGVCTDAAAQVIYVDTPGITATQDDALRRHMARQAAGALASVDVVLLVVEALKWTPEDALVLDQVREAGVPVILVINKVDRLKDRSRLLAFIDELRGRQPFAAVVPVSARDGTNLDRLKDEIRRLLPEAPPLFPDDQVTDRSVRFLAAELVREKLIRRLGAELPYSLAVTVESFREQPELVVIDAVVWVETEGQKAIVIGKGGTVLKAVGEKARLDLERMLGRKVLLRTWARVKRRWRDDVAALRQFGYSD